MSKVSSLRSLAAAVPEARLTEEAIETIRVELRDLRESVQLAGERSARLAALHSARERIAPQILTEQAIGALRQEVQQLESAAATAANRLEGVAGPLATLQTAARELFASGHDHSSDECPLCGHDWALRRRCSKRSRRHWQAFRRLKGSRSKHRALRARPLVKLGKSLRKR